MNEKKSDITKRMLDASLRDVTLNRMAFVAALVVPASVLVFGGLDGIPEAVAFVGSWFGVFLTKWVAIA